MRPEPSPGRVLANAAMWLIGTALVCLLIAVTTDHPPDQPMPAVHSGEEHFEQEFFWP